MQGRRKSLTGLKPDPEKLRAVQAMTKPSNTKELKTFLGFIQYLAKFLPDIYGRSQCTSSKVAGKEHSMASE